MIVSSLASQSGVTGLPSDGLTLGNSLMYRELWSIGATHWRHTREKRGADAYILCEGEHSNTCFAASPQSFAHCTQVERSVLSHICQQPWQRLHRVSLAVYTMSLGSPAFKLKMVAWPVGRGRGVRHVFQDLESKHDSPSMLSSCNQLAIGSSRPPRAFRIDCPRSPPITAHVGAKSPIS